MVTKSKNHFGDRLFYSIRKKNNYLCLGIDPHLNLIPKVFQSKIKITSTPYSKNNIKIVEYFCKSLIDALADLIPAIKIQIAFFEQLGPEGMKLLSKLCHIIRKKEIICIIDCKRGDIGSTNHGYANAFFSAQNPYPCDAITVNPWLGIETLNAFEKFIPKYGLFILVHTSNPGSKDLQEQLTINNEKLYEVLIEKLKPIISKNIGKNKLSSVGIVTGATFPKEILSIRKKLPFAPFLIPGFGAQGGSLEDAKLGLVSDVSYNNKLNFGIINSSRSLCFPKSAKNCKDIKTWKREICCNLEKKISNLHN
ncbi:orotidine-5'-phosphate decarboxylase [Alphaproteobacteria bacterium]|nr:orotidine-5'-phosphate decarboxylase [Alphaproteobacteria bacterium]